MTNYYWIIAQHSGKVLEVKGGSFCSSVEIIQHTKKSELDHNVDMQLWYFNGGFITNKRSGFVLDVQGWRFENGKSQEPSRGREWEYDYEDNTISLKFNRKFVLDVAGGSNDNGALIILHEKHGGKNQQFILQKWDDGSAVIENAVTNITENFKFLPRLSQNFLEILNDDEYYDVNIEVGNDPCVKTFHAHKVVLSYRSPYLRRKLSTNKKNRDGILARIELSNILPEIFEIILRYIYSGRLSLKEYDTLDIVKLLVAANELNLQELVAHIQSFLIENKVNWMEQNFDLIYQTSFEDNSFLDLQKYCNDLISNEPDKIFESQNFTSIPEKLLISVIQNDNLQMSEIQIWEYVLKWGIAQNRELPSSPKEYSKEDFKTLKSILKQYIPFIRFYNLNSKEFAEKVHPYKKVLPKELYEELLLSLLNSDNKKGESKPRIPRNIGSKDIDSNIITSQHAEIISKWVNKLEVTDKLTSPHEFKLLFRGSRDGFYSNKFHEICDLQSRTVAIAKVKDSNEILGGDESHILSRIVDNRYSIDNRSYYGPSFGNGDLIIWGLDTNTLCNYCYACKNSYEKSITKTKDRFSIEEYEVFRLMNIYQKI
ncbi:carbohydrate-binding module family 13 protein [Rhizophagus clarus]|uniref:Carbohydrate-binding module family 13 protein n=1 Tax=Rhizophagus clarus TaxID=94130 RepID=A0A8H3MGD0_9GLOM|nr:carbohydrate-binding module family 13 protein [Rhizophagus clarus]